jgi:hypothetical protein
MVGIKDSDSRVALNIFQAQRNSVLGEHGAIHSISHLHHQPWHFPQHHTDVSQLHQNRPDNNRIIVVLKE